MKKSNGFTLIEVLIVIVIIGILSAFFINLSQNSLKQGRDGRRKTDLETIRAGLETYFADCNRYPVSLTFGSSLVGSTPPTSCSSSNIYIANIPRDPKYNSGSGPAYIYYSTGTNYEICAQLETGTGSASCGGSSVCGSGTCNYKVISP